MYTIIILLMTRVIFSFVLLTGAFSPFLGAGHSLKKTVCSKGGLRPQCYHSEVTDTGSSEGHLEPHSAPDAHTGHLFYQKSTYFVK